MVQLKPRSLSSRHEYLTIQVALLCLVPGTAFAYVQLPSRCLRNAVFRGDSAVRGLPHSAMYVRFPEQPCRPFPARRVPNHYRASKIVATAALPPIEVASGAFSKAIAAFPLLFQSAVEQDVFCALFCTVSAAAWVWIWTGLAASGKIPSVVSRKVVHAGSAPLLMLCWPLFSEAPSGLVAASFVPLLQAFRLFRAGTAADDDTGSDKGLIQAVSRTGARAEALKGPLIYTLVLLCATVFGWRSIVASTALCQMAVGDGLADIFGRRFGGTKWPFAPSKSYVGSAAFALSAFLASAGFVSFFHACGYTSATALACWPSLLAISILCAAVELVPVADDNLTVPFTAMLLSILLLHS